MKAVLMQRGKLWVESVDDPVPEAGEVLVKSRACGICGSDLHAVEHTDDFVQTSREAGGAFKLTTYEPVVLGHEFCAEIVDVGPDSDPRLKPGQLVCSVPVLTRSPFVPLGYSDEAPGGFAEYMVLSGQLLVPVPDGTPASHAALTEPMAVGYHAVNKARLGGDEAALVLGCGPVGLAVIAALAQKNVHPIIASDFSPGRRRFAEIMGADVVVDPAATSPFAHPDAGRRGGVVVFECVGVPGMIDRIFLEAPNDARIVVVGVCLQMDHSRPLIAINKELNVQYVLGYSLEEFTDTLGFIAEGQYDVGPIITAEVPLDGVADAFAALADPEEHAKVLVTPWA